LRKIQGGGGMKFYEALWTHRISKHGATKVTPFELVYDQEAMLPVEVNLDAYRFAKQNDLSAVVCYDLMMDNIDEVTDVRLKALKEIEKDKTRVAKAYNKKVRSKSFQVEELVWKTILPIGSKCNQFGKWSPN
jgi:dihydroneopterin aldolase